MRRFKGAYMTLALAALSALTSVVPGGVSQVFGEDADIVFADFEGDDYGGWKIEGEAFGTKPASGTLAGQMDVSGYRGSGLVNSFFGGDRTTGTLTSPEFEISRPYINFLIGGGGVKGLSFALVVDGEVVRQAAGPNVVPGGSEELDQQSWDVTDLQGKKGFFRIVDEATGGWGHINVDHIVLSSVRASTNEHVREYEITAPYLMIPTKQTSASPWIRIEVDGKVVREFTAPLALSSDERDGVDFDACVDMSSWLGKKCRVVVEKTPDDLDLAPLSFSDKPFGGVEGYHEKYRPQFHFSPRIGWTNDPNGLTYYNGVYHLFYQHNPFKTTWGNMTWGHATSSDLLHWTEHGDALYPDRLGTIFSGSGAVDVNNTTGFQKDPAFPPLVVMYTANGGNMRYGEEASQCLAYSVDGGKTFEKYDGNPTIPHIVGGNRDPKIFWHEPSDQWIVALYMDGEDYALFGSPDLKSWKQLCSIKNLGCSECPDIFELPVDGDENNRLWVFWGGNGKYLLGRFDGQNFERLTEPLDAKWGGNDYAAQSYSDTPGRRIQFSWMSGGSYPGMPFNQQFTVPRELTLRETEEGPRLYVNPVAEVESLRGEKTVLKMYWQQGGEARFLPQNGESKDYNLLDCELQIKQSDARKPVIVEARGHRIELDPAAKTMTYGDVVAPLALVDGAIKLRILLDVTSIEIFAADGRSQIAACFVPDDDNDAPILRLDNVDTSAFLRDHNPSKVSVWTMKSVWK